MELASKRRSQLLEALLAQQMQPRNDIINPIQLAAELGAQAIRQRGIKKLREEEKTAETESNRRIADALAGFDGRQNIDLQSIDGGSEIMSIPQKRGAEGQQRRAAQLASLAPEERAAVADIRTMERQAAAPSLSEEIKLREESQARINQAQNSAALERAQFEADAQATRQERDLEFRADQSQKDRLFEEEAQIRSIQAQFGLENIKSENAIKEIQEKARAVGLDLTEAQTKATGWYTSAAAGETVISQYLTGENPYVPSINSISLYAKSIDPDTGAAQRVQLRRLIPQQALNFLDAANMIVDPIVRMRTGAAVRSDEFITTFNSVIPIGAGSETERNNKNFFRTTMIDAMAAMSGGGHTLGAQIIAGKKLPVQERDDVDGVLTQKQRSLVDKYLTEGGP